jgi:hypothetical protein
MVLRNIAVNLETFCPTTVHSQMRGHAYPRCVRQNLYMS